MSHLPERIAEKLYTYAFFDNFLLIYPFYSLLFADSGISPTQISLLFIVWSLSSFLLEIPAGALADKYPRKNILLIGSLAKIIGFLFWLLMQNFVGFMIGFIFWGIKTSFTSGTLEAFVYDELARVRKQKMFAKLFGKVEAFFLAGLIASGFAASALAKIGYNWILILSILSLLVSTAALLTLPRPRNKMKLEETKYLDYLKQGVGQVFRKPVLLWLILFISVLAGFAAIDEYFSLFLREKGFTNAPIAIMTGIIYGGAAVGSMLAHKLEGKRLPLRMSLFGWALILYLAAIAPGLLAPLLIALYVLIFAAIQVLFMSYLQKEANDKTRATTTSVSGFADELFALFAYGVMSLGTMHGGYVLGYKLMAGFIAIMALILVLRARSLKLKY